MQMQIEKVRFVLVNENPLGRRFYVGSVNKWGEEYPDAMKFECWADALEALTKLEEAFPDSPAVQRAKIEEV